MLIDELMGIAYTLYTSVRGPLWQNHFHWFNNCTLSFEWCFILIFIHLFVLHTGTKWNNEPMSQWWSDENELKLWKNYIFSACSSNTTTTTTTIINKKRIFFHPIQMKTHYLFTLCLPCMRSKWVRAFVEICLIVFFWIRNTNEYMIFVYFVVWWLMSEFKCALFPFIRLFIPSPFLSGFLFPSIMWSIALVEHFLT